MRGNRVVAELEYAGDGSIPAYAGEPCGGPDCACGPEVYPRVCGGTRWPKQRGAIKKGLSPRMRGNRQPRQQETWIRRSIPAYAGEPLWQRGTTCAKRVYPRVCGGTAPGYCPAGWKRGLSPRMRGNLLSGYWIDAPPRSIPAYAGEPLFRPLRRASSKVYPRVCGGTRNTIPPARSRRGLSPRMRGNLSIGEVRNRFNGSIPAYAGEPDTGCPMMTQRRIYPRVCGGTSPAVQPGRQTDRLSPRMRGNLANLVFPDGRARSIPAYAGEPPGPFLPPRIWRVYPRVCGGTRPNHGSYILPCGLSPRMRGNPIRGMWWTGSAGSIPAYAGEPALSAF